MMIIRFSVINPRDAEYIRSYNRVGRWYTNIIYSEQLPYHIIIDRQ